MGRRLRQALFSWPFLVVLVTGLAGGVLAYQFDTAHVVDVGDTYDLFFLQDFHEREPTPPVPGEERFRWSRGRSVVRFPGVGAGARNLSLRLHGWRPAGQPAPHVRVSLNGQLLAAFEVAPEWQDYVLWVSPEAVRGATQELVLETTPFTPAEAGVGGDPRPLGVAVDEVALIPLAGRGFAPGWPAWGQVGWALLFAAALYLGLAVVLLPRWWAGAVAGLAVGALSWALASRCLWTTIYTHRLAIVTLLGLVLLPLLRWLFGRILAWGQVPVDERGMRLLLAIFLVGFWIKAAGLLYPSSVAWDLLWHLEKAQRVTAGRLDELYRPGYFSQEVMPPEWELEGEGLEVEKPMIPYSPYYHITAAAFFYLPWRPYDTANVISVLLDTTKPFLIYFLARRLGLGRREGLLAGLLYAVLPATFLLHAWGNMPTQTGLWWTLASTCYIVGAWERLRQPRTWAGLALFLLGTMLYYTVMAAFMVVFVAILSVGLALDRWGFRGGRSVEQAVMPRLAGGQPAPGAGSPGRRPIHPSGPIALALLAAIALSTAIYYGQYIRPIVEVTIPYFRSVAQRGSGGGVVPVSWSVYLRQHLERLSSLRYGLIWPIVLAGGGLVIGRRHLRQARFRWLLIAWFGTALLFFLVGFRVDMVDKEIFYAMPALALCAAIALGWLWRRGRAGRALVVVLVLFLVAASLQTWVFRLSTVQQEWLNSDAPIVGECLPHWGGRQQGGEDLLVMPRPYQGIVLN